MWNILKLEQQGRSHVKQDVPCQDKTYGQSYDGTYVMALADGAGSAPLSHYGAECVVKCVADELGLNFESYWNELNARIAKERLFRMLYEALQKQADQRECELKDLASTLLVVAVKDNRFMILHVGDGVIGYHDEEGLKVASAPTNGEFANTTFFVTSSEACEQARIFRGDLGSITGFVLMSDGPEACLYNHQNKTLANGLLEILNDVGSKDLDEVSRDLKEAMNSVITQHTMDDCSLALMEKKAVATEMPEEEAPAADDRLGDESKEELEDEPKEEPKNEPNEEPMDDAETIDLSGDNAHPKETACSDGKSGWKKYLIILLILLVVILYILL